MKKFILVTGGAGFIGSHLVDKLLGLGKSVIVIDDFSNGCQTNLSQHLGNENLRIIHSDICNPLGVLFENFSINEIFHLAAVNKVRYSYEDPAGTYRVNVGGTKNMVEMAKKYKVKRFIFASSSSVYGDQKAIHLHEDLPLNPISPYGLQKLESEKLVKDLWLTQKIKSLIFRYFNVFGERQSAVGPHAAFIPKSIQAILSGQKPEIYGSGLQKRDFTYVENITQANILGLNCSNHECYGEVFNIGFGHPRTVSSVAESISRLSKENISWNSSPQVNEPFENAADISKAQSCLGYNPKISFETGIERTWAYFHQKRQMVG